MCQVYFTLLTARSFEIKHDQREKKCTKSNLKTPADIFFDGSSFSSRIFLARVVMMLLQTYQSVLVASNKKSSSTVWLSRSDVCFC